jgi:hypothetical protein
MRFAMMFPAAFRRDAAIGKSCCFRYGDGMIPDTLKLIVAVAAIVGAAWGLAHFPPEQTTITKSLPDERLKQK